MSTAASARRRAPLLVLAVALAGWALLPLASPSPAPSAPFSLTAPTRIDIGFAQAMIEHHDQAVTMAGIVLLGRGASPEVRALASDIEVVQLQQIGMMQGWLSLWDAPPVASGSPMAWMSARSMPGMVMAPGSTMAGPMPGMASQPELGALARARGHALDVRFLELMLRHHQGGVLMARDAAAHARVPQVRALAEQMVVDQTQEIGLMGALLAREPHPPAR
jgi:uncharacterized protein (DUF305 family)